MPYANNFIDQDSCFIGKTGMNIICILIIMMLNCINLKNVIKNGRSFVQFNMVQRCFTLLSLIISFLSGKSFFFSLAKYGIIFC
jgi:hypothetical protein